MLSKTRAGKGQASVEFLVILAVSLLVFAGIVSFANTKVVELTDKTLAVEAQLVVDSLALNAKSLILQGNNASRIVMLEFPKEVNVEKSGVFGKTIVLHVKGVDYLASNNFQMQGSLPLQEGRQFVMLKSENNAVVFSPVQLLAKPNSFFVLLTQGSEKQETLKLENVSNSVLNVSIQTVFSGESVSIGLSKNSFELQPQSFEEVSVLFSAESIAEGTQNGVFKILSQGREVMQLPLTVEVVETTALQLFPSRWEQDFVAGQAFEKTLSVCNNSQNALQNVSFSFSGSILEWFSEVQGISVLNSGCAERTVSGKIPEGIVGEFKGLIVASSTAGSDSVKLDFNVLSG